jgi:hypothetical protein
MLLTYRTMTLSKLVPSVILACGAAVAEPGAALSVAVLTGDDVVVSTRSGRGADIKVRVTGMDNQPVEHATVTAVLPAIGAGGSFAGGETVKSKTTASDGTVDFRGLRVRRIAGDIPIRIVARRGQHVGSAIAHQKAADTDAGSDAILSKRRIAIIGVAAAGVTAAILAATMNGSEPAQPAFNVTPGAPVTTGPR